MKAADINLNKIKNESHQMTPEDRVSHTMELQEDVAAKVQVIKKYIELERELLPQGNLDLKLKLVWSKVRFLGRLNLSIYIPKLTYK